MTIDVQIVERAEQPYVGVTRTVTMQTFADVADRIPEMIGRLAQRGVAPAGAPFLRYLEIDMERGLVVEAGVPVAEPVTGDDTMDANALPAGRYATVLHRGHPDELVGVTGELLDWAGEHGHTWDVSPDGRRWGARLEAFHTNPMEVSGPDEWVTEVAIRLA